MLSYFMLLIIFLACAFSLLFDLMTVGFQELFRLIEDCVFFGSQTRLVVQFPDKMFSDRIRRPESQPYSIDRQLFIYYWLHH